MGLRVWVRFGALSLTMACAADPIEFDGELGRAIPLLTGDGIALPRVTFIDEGCPGDAARGGCPASGDRSCQPLLIDSLVPLTTLKQRGNDASSSFARECFEIRESAGLGEAPPTEDALAAAVARFRFRNAPLVRAPSAGTDDWAWAAGDQTVRVEPRGVIGGNLLRSFAVAIRSPPADDPVITFYGEFPGSERDLADAGFAFAPLQFPGRLLGRDLSDVCDIDGERCELNGFSLQGVREIALRPTRMVLDACVGVPPCGVQYRTIPEDPFAAGTCSAELGPDALVECTPMDDPTVGGSPASLVVATGVSGIVLFEDSARRMFGALEELPLCSAATAETAACRRTEAPDGALYLSGWPPAGDPERGDTPLHRLGVRALAIVPGLTRARGEGPCKRAQDRMNALLNQCQRFVDDFTASNNIEDTTPPYRSDDAEASSNTSLMVIGEANFATGQLAPDPSRWLETIVLPESHPSVLSLRRDVAPEAIQPDGLIGAALFHDSVAVLDYTDPNPGLRLQCLDPRSGDCLVAPDCAADAQPACCYGLPLDLLVEYIVFGDDEVCCEALSADELAEIQSQGLCLGTSRP
jgi:hypothetical protein